MALKQEQILTLKQRLEQAPVIETKKDNYRPFLNITGDDNPIHTDEGYSSKTPFQGLVVPGLYLAFIVGRYFPNDMAGIELFFRHFIKPGNEVRFLQHNPAGGAIRAGWYNMSEQKEMGEPKPSLEARINLGKAVLRPEEIISEYEKDVKFYGGKLNEKKISDMMEMAGMVPAPERALNMHVAGLVSRVLLLFSTKGTTGAYKRQQLKFHSPLLPNERFKVLARIADRKKRKGPLVNFDYNIIGCDNRPIITGTARVAEIKYQ